MFRSIVTQAALTGVLFLASGAAADPAPQKVGRAMVTFYWVIDESSPKYRGDQSAVLRDPRGRVIARTHKQFKLDLVRQGTGWLRDGRTINYIKKVNGESRFRITTSKYGLGSTGCRLVPWRTIAVDPRFVPLGTRISIPQLKGARLPDGTIHDGIFIAADRGHFRGARVDLFVGAGSTGARPFIRKGYGSRSRVTVYTAGRGGRCGL
ncbi:MAG TPA: 3D domain-containing protein [Thermoanaerobaculia bacterium]|nr:3D domain-containing protein [Thermoanaerobaculia bacterium]